jgi:uncharacterized protein YqjF (DUF2071 family)
MVVHAGGCRDGAGSVGGGENPLRTCAASSRPSGGAYPYKNTCRYIVVHGHHVFLQLLARSTVVISYWYSRIKLERAKKAKAEAAALKKAKKKAAGKK